MRKFVIDVWVIVNYDCIFISWSYMQMQMRIWRCFFVKVI